MKTSISIQKSFNYAKSAKKTKKQGIQSDLNAINYVSSLGSPHTMNIDVDFKEDYLL
jgi:hypothetical protein